MNFRQTIIYQRSLELNGLARDLIASFPVGYGFLTDQLRRAASSVTLNFAEGCGKSSPRDQRRFFMIARGSAYEVAAVFDLAKTWKILDPAAMEHGHEICDHLAGMLYKYR